MPDFDTKDVQRLEALARELFPNAAGDAADAIMGLLVAAVHLAMTDRGQTGDKLVGTLASMLGAATVCADDFFGLNPKH